MTAVNWKHRLSNVDEEALLGDCLTCGRIPLSIKHYKGVARYRCSVARKEQAKKKASYKERGNHGVTYEDAAKMREIAKVCKICGSDKQLVIDHCHDSKVLRGVICHLCNVSIGYMRDNPNWLRNAADYLDNEEGYLEYDNSFAPYNRKQIVRRRRA